MSTTHVTLLNPQRGQALHRELSKLKFDFRSIPHSVFSARGEGVTLTLYNSGKCVIQGSGTKEFVSKFLGEEIAEAEASQKIEAPIVGSDESGKGDYFGPLVVAACLIKPGDEARLKKIGVADSKKVSDHKILASEAEIKRAFPHAVASVMPEEYNRRYESCGNLNVLLGELHAQVIAEIVKSHEVKDALADKFGDDRHIAEPLRAAGVSISLTQRPKAESHPAVAAASFLARAEFLYGMKNLDEKSVTPLPRGASQAVDKVAAEIVRLQGREALRGFAKLHFKITDRVS